MRLAILVLLAACGSSSQRTTISIGLTLVDEERAPTARMSLDDAIARRHELRRDDPPPGLQRGERAWFFRAYDDDELVFLEASYDPYDDPEPTKRVGRYRVERRVIVPRSERAEVALEVRRNIEPREEGVCGVRVGMTAAEVSAQHGTPTDVTHMQAAGCVVQYYQKLAVQLCHEQVINVSAERCP